MKKLFKILAFLLVFLVVVLFVLRMIFNESKPVGQTGPAAEALAQKMLLAVDQPAWDSTRVLQWTFKGMHDFLWDKKRNYAEVKWDDNKVQLILDEVDGKAWKAGKELSGEEARKLIDKAWGYWCNDSFWFNAVVKVFDKGTQRSIVKQPDGSDALMVTYDSGGVTPGDSYLWILDENGLPKSWKMWVSIIPLGGLEFSWEKWVDLSTGAKISSFHTSKFLDLDLTNLKGEMDFESFGGDPFVIGVGK